MPYLAIVLSLLIASCNTSTNTDGVVKKEATPSSGASIQISTSNAVALYKDIHSSTAVDIFFGKQFQPRDILAEPYFSFVKALNLNTIQYSGGSTSDYDHVIIGDARIKGGKGDGYNINLEDIKKRNDDINTALDGVGAVRFGKDFFNEYCALLKKLGIQGDVNANVQGGTLEELFWKIEQSNAKRVVFGLEQDLQSNAFDYPDGASYKRKLTSWVEAVEKKYPDVATILDAAPVYRPNERFTKWNEQLQGMPCDGVRMYMWDKDAVEWTTDYNQNVNLMNEVFSTTLPKWLNAVQKRFPGKKAAVWQWGIKARSEINNTMAACIYIGKFYKFAIDYNKANSNYISYACYYTLKSLDRGDGKILTNYHALKTCGLLFKGNKRVLDLTLNGMPGVSGVACDENGRYTLLLVNETGSEVSVPSVSVNNSSVQGKQFQINSVYASSLASKSVTTDTRSLSTITLRPYSVSVIEF